MARPNNDTLSASHACSTVSVLKVKPAMDRAGARRRQLIPRHSRNRKQKVSDVFSHSFAACSQREEAAHINEDQLIAVTELCQSTPALRRSIDGLVASVFAARGLELVNVATDEAKEMDFAQQSYIKEFFLAPLRVACEQLFCYGVTAIDVQKIKSTEAKTSAYYQLARAINAEAVAKRQLGLFVLPLNLVLLDHENGHTVEDHPEAVVFEFNRIDAEGNLTSSISSAVSLYGFTSEMAEITAASWRSLSRPQVVVQARCVAPRPVRKQNAPW